MNRRLCISAALLSIAALSAFGQNNFKHIATLTGDKLTDGFGMAIATGDINGDGFADLIVGAPVGNYADGNYVKIFMGEASSEGSGSMGIDTTADYVLHCDQLFYSGFGYSITCGDVNGDGIDDLIIGVPYYNEGGYDTGIYCSGRVYIYYGSLSFDTIPDKILIPPGDLWDCFSYYFGSTVAVVGDVNGDGKCDLAVGAKGPSAAFGAGTVSIYYGGTNFDVNPALTLSGQQNIDGFLGESIAGVGDINQDGYDDILVGAWAVKEGRAYLIYGGTTMQLSRGRVYSGDTTSHGFGRHLTNLHDINGDGVTEVGIEGAEQLEIISLGSSSDSVLAVIKKETGWGSFQSIAACRDLNDDGLSDFFVGIENQADRYAGKVFAYLGRRDSIPRRMCELNGTMDFGYLGSALAYCGKMSNDERRVLCVGEDQADGTKGPGRVQVYNYDFVQSVDKRPISSPQSFSLAQNYPNPFNPVTIISFDIQAAANVTIGAYDCLGRQVATVVNRRMVPGHYEERFDASALGSGVYFYKMIAGDYAAVKKMLLLR